MKDSHTPDSQDQDKGGSSFIKGLFRKYVTAPPSSASVQFIRSLVVGGVATVVDMGALILLKELTSSNTIIAATIGFILGLTTNYLMSTFWAFRGLNTKKRSTEFIIFCIIGVIGLLLNNLIIHLFENTFAQMLIFGSLLPADKYYIVGKCVATVVVFVWNFGLRKLLLYSKGKKDK